MREFWKLDEDEILRLLGVKGLFAERKPRRAKAASHAPRRRKKSKRRFWTAGENELLRRLYPETSNAALAIKFNRTKVSLYNHAALLGLRKSAAWLASAEACKLRRNPEVGLPYRFKPGMIPWNKGMKYPPGWAPGRMRETQYKKGELNGSAREKWKPVGAVVVDMDGYLRIKVRERVNGLPRGWDKSIWPLLHHREWEKHHGPVPKGYKLTFRDGDKTHIALENLELISDAEMMRHNSVHNLPQELQKVIQLAGALKRQLSVRSSQRSGE